MTTTTESPSAAVRAHLDHPIIDGDSHIVEFMPTFFDYLKDVGGSDIVKRYRDSSVSRRWAAMSWDERLAERVTIPPWWALPTENTLDRATAMMPRLLHERMDEVGMDYVVLYPTIGLGFPHMQDDEIRQAVCRAFNEFTADQYTEFSDRMTVAAVIPLNTPEEGLAELEHAHSLGLKVAQMPAFVRRPVAAVAEKYPELANRVTWIDSFGIDSDYDYDPFWQRCLDLGFAVASHSGGMGFTGPFLDHELHVQPHRSLRGGRRGALQVDADGRRDDPVPRAARGAARGRCGARCSRVCRHHRALGEARH